MTVKEAATRLGVTSGRVRQFICGGRLRAVKRAGANFVRPSEVERLARELVTQKKRGPRPNVTQQQPKKAEGE